MGDATAAWVIGDSLDDTGESLTKSSIPPDFTRASIPADPDGTDIESNLTWGANRALLAIPSRPALGVKESVSEVRAKASREKKTVQYGCVAHPHTYATFNVNN